MSSPPPNPQNGELGSTALFQSTSDGSHSPPRNELIEDIVELEQPYFVYDSVHGWRPGNTVTAAGSTTEADFNPSQACEQELSPPLATFTLLTWNVDFMAADETERLNAILDYIRRTLVDPGPLPSEPEFVPRVPPILLLQEVHYDCFPALLTHPLIRTLYALSDISPATWSEPEAGYGLVTLVPRVIAPHIRRVFRTQFPSRMAREALFVDLHAEGRGIIRVANTHLESLRGKADYVRTIQLGIVAHRLVAEGVHAGIVGGDMNPIGPFDHGLPERLGLNDAWVVQRDTQRDLTIDGNEQDFQDRVNDDNVVTDLEGGEGYTWGTQPLNRFPKRRMDKILYTGGVTTGRIERVGIGLKASVGNGEEKWASDHFGLLAQVTVTDPTPSGR